MLSLIIENGKLAHSKVSSSGWGNDPFSCQVELCAFEKLKFEKHLFIGRNYLEFYIKLVFIAAHKQEDHPEAKKDEYQYYS